MSRRVTLFSATLGEDRKIEPPLGPLYIASALETAGWCVDFRDYQLFAAANAFDPELIVDCLRDHAPVVMISCFVDMLPVVIGAAALIKATEPDTYILLGGPGPTAGALELLKTYPSLDAIVMGEGEETVKEWSDAYAVSADTHFVSSHPIAGMVYRTPDGIAQGGPRERIADLPAAMIPAYHLLDWSHYSTGRIITTRGCPYRCSFCDVAPLWGRKAVYRDVVSTVEEMILLRDRYGRKGVAIADDTFVLNRDRVRAFCELLLERRVGMEWGCFGRINLMSESLIALMAEAGCRSIFYGIDSGSPGILKRTLKELDPESILPALEISTRYFQFIEASFIWGYPFETLEDFRLTVEMAAKASMFAPAVNVQLHMLSPLPSSPVLQEFEGRLLPPEPEDKHWLLLPGVLLDERAAAVRDIILRNASLFPGFHTFPTPNKAGKRELLEDVMKNLNATLGRAFLDERVFSLFDTENEALEKMLLCEARDDCARIGVGLALGVFRRTRIAKHPRQQQPPAALRGASLVRQRNDAPLLRVL
jgi:radical SAM superfamily enzyme YgiQ (UPF0313 family)